MKYYNEKFGRPIIFLIAFLLGVFVFPSNTLHTVDNRFFEGLDRFSQILITGRLIAHDAGVDNQGWNTGSASINGVILGTEDDLGNFKNLVSSGTTPDVAYFPYKSQFGIQGAGFLWLHDVLHLDVFGLQFCNAVLFALVIALLTMLFCRAYDWKYALAFFVVMVTSPWTVGFARNLYWVPFLWFLPAVFSTLLYLSKTATGRWLSSIGLLLSIFVKSLAGYEYLSSITILACSVFVVAPLFNSSNRSYFSNVKLAALASVLCVLGFIFALLLHAGMRGDTIASGIVNIIEQDVKKRTFGDPSAFDPILADSLKASVADVLQRYWSWRNWGTPVFAGIHALFLNLSVVVVGLGLIYSVARRRWRDLRIIALVAMMLLAPLSWFVLAKSHSYVHNHLNFVLWYFGFIPAFVYAVFFFTWRMGLDAVVFLVRKRTKGKASLAVLALAWTAHLSYVDEALDIRYAATAASFDLGASMGLLTSATELTLPRTDCHPSDRLET